MNILKYPWKFVNTRNKYLWVYVIIRTTREYAWVSVIIREYTWVPVITRDYTWIPVTIRDYTWISGNILHSPSEWWIEWYLSTYITLTHHTYHTHHSAVSKQVSLRFVGISRSVRGVVGSKPWIKYHVLTHEATWDASLVIYVMNRAY